MGWGDYVTHWETNIDILLGRGALFHQNERRANAVIIVTICADEGEENQVNL